MERREAGRGISSGMLSDLAFQFRFRYTALVANVRKSWDRIARHYRDRYEISSEVVHYGPLCPGEDKLQLLGDIKDKNIIDLGCGGGQNSVALARKGGRVTAVDFSSEQIAQAENLAKEEGFSIDFRACDISDLSFSSGSRFDIALSACAISFAEDILTVFREVYRVLKPGGMFVLSDMNPLQYIVDEIDGGVEFNETYPYEPILLKWGWEFNELKNIPRFQHYVRSIPEYANKIVESGFVVYKILEPRSTIDTPHAGFSREIMEEYPYIAKHIPITFIILCRRQ
jgi:ubiquinone/menaquinone biosynthesis C-methylase UbiE